MNKTFKYYRKLKMFSDLHSRLKNNLLTWLIKVVTTIYSKVGRPDGSLHCQHCITDKNGKKNCFRLNVEAASAEAMGIQTGRLKQLEKNLSYSSLPKQDDKELFIEALENSMASAITHLISQENKPDR